MYYKEGKRRFSEFNEKSVVPLFENAGFNIMYNEVGADNRPGREDEMWVNVIVKKQNSNTLYSVLKAVLWHKVMELFFIAKNT